MCVYCLGDSQLERPGHQGHLGRHQQQGRNARHLSDLRILAGNRLEALKGDRAGRYSIRVNNQYRITFEFTDGHAYLVRCEDYH